MYKKRNSTFLLLFRSSKPKFYRKEKTWKDLIDETQQNDYAALRTRSNYYDKKIEMMLREDEHSIDELDRKYLFECFKYGLNNVVLLAMDKSPEERQQQLNIISKRSESFGLG